MAANMTSLVRCGPESANSRVQMYGCGFAMMAIANPWRVHRKISHSETARPPRRPASRRYSACARPDLFGDSQVLRNVTSVRTKSTLIHYGMSHKSCLVTNLLWK